MTIVGVENLSRFANDKPTARALTAWRRICEDAQWKRFMDVRCQFPRADSVGSCVVFDIRHNRFRIIAQVNYGARLVNVVSVLAHAEYQRGGWKHGCDC
jgi:mRNA interferase HigB